MSRLSDLWEKLDELNIRKAKGEDVQQKIDTVVKEMDEIRALAEKKFGEPDDATLAQENEAAYNRQPGQHLPHKPRR